MTRLRSCTWLGGLTLLLLACSSGGSSSPSAPPPPPTGNVVEVTVDDNVFIPRSVEIEPGQTVRWVRAAGSTPNHTVTERSDLDGVEEWDSGFLDQPGDTFQRTFEQADDGKTFEYLCRTHWESDAMQGSIRVGEDAPPPNPGY